MLHTVKTLSNLMALDSPNIGQHDVRSKVPDQIKKIKSVIKMMKIKTYLLVDRAAVW